MSAPTTDQIVGEPIAAPETTIGGYRAHPAANLIPEASPEDYARIRADIQEHGLRELIVMTVDDQTDEALILDGRTRAKILDELGVEIRTEPLIEKRVWKAHRNARYLEDDDPNADPIAFVLSANAARRHLSGDQIIALYLKANTAKLEADKLAAKVAQQAGLKKGTAQPVSTTMKPTGKTAEKIAKAVGKSKSAVERVQRVQKDAPERLADVAAGKVSAAKVLEASKPKPTAAKAPSNKTDRLEVIFPHETPKERRAVVKVLDKAFEDFPGALIAIEMGAMCLTPAHIKTLTKWRDQIDAILRKRAEVELAPSTPEAAADLAPEPR